MEAEAASIESLKEYSDGLYRALKQKNRELESIRSSLAELVGSAPIGIFETTPGGKFLSANPAFAAMLGYDTPEQVLGLDLCGDVAYDALELPPLPARLTGDDRHFETRLKRRDGSPLWIVAEGRAVKDDSGRVVRLAAFVSDITARKKAEEDLDRSSREAIRGRERRALRDAVLLVLVGLAVFAIAGRLGIFPGFVTWVARHSGGRHDLDELIVALAVTSLAGPLFSYRRWRDLKSEIVERERTEQALSLLRRDLEARVESRTAELREINRRLVNEIEDHRRADAALRESEERYREIFDGSPLPMWLIDDADFRILDVNEAAVELYGYSRKELLKMSIFDIRPPEDVAGLQQRLRAPRPPRWHAGIWKHRKKDGTLIDVDVYTHQVTLRGRRLRLALLRDVSEQVRLEEQFRQSQKMEAIGLLAGGIAHDFNNLLTAILGYADLLAARSAPGSPQEEDVREIRKAGERAANLTRQLLAFSRKQVLEPKVLDLNELVGDLEKMLHRLIGEDIALTSALAPELCRVRADAGQLEQVILNLAVNSRDAMPGGGDLTIETENVELDELYAQNHPSVAPGKYVMLAVSDTGVGMDAETRARAFEPFFTTKGEGKGTGLGLATVYGIVKQSGGNIWLYSEPGRGTTFKIFLPAVAGSAQEVRADALRPASGGGEVVLLVEDERPVRSLTRTILEELGYRVLEASRGSEALEIARTNPEPIDLLLTDLVMPEIRGNELARMIRKLRPGIRVLCMSGYTGGSLLRDCGFEEGVLFLPKPFTSETLARKTREALGGS